MSKRYRKNPHTAGRVINGLAYIVTPDTNRLHTLNATATHLWRMAHSGVTVEEGAGGLAAEFDVTADSALGEVEACLRDLEERLILVGS